MKRILLILLIVSCFKTYAQEMTYKRWQKESQEDIRMLPEYGNVKKSDEQIKSDNELINEELKQSGTREKASDGLVRLGFDYMYKGNLKTAMSRFNQAWLLNPKNEDAYWGFGSIYFMLGNQDAALLQFNKGLSINPSSTNIITDVATIFMSKYATNHNKTDLEKAINLFNKSYNINPKNQNTLFKLSALYLYVNDCGNAKKFYDLCMDLGGKPITEEYKKAISEQCKL